MLRVCTCTGGVRVRDTEGNRGGRGWEPGKQEKGRQRGEAGERFRQREIGQRERETIGNEKEGQGGLDGTLAMFDSLPASSS